MEEQAFKQIEDEPKNTNNQISLPNLKNNNNETQDETINELPSWNLEPPVEINRGQNEIR